MKLLIRRLMRPRKAAGIINEVVDLKVKRLLMDKQDAWYSQLFVFVNIVV